ncbi:MAG: hypothetical protein ACR2L8_01680, partial [Solirubrobacteraceae bacterium]
MSQHTSRPSSTPPRAGGSHARDLRFAGALSAGLICAILVGGALVAPVTNWKGLPSQRAGDGTQTVRLAPAPRTAQPASGSGSSTSAPAAGVGPVAVASLPLG